MLRPVIVDTGPLVAILRERDTYHQSCVSVVRETAKPLLTSWPVVTEAAWLLRTQVGGVGRLFQILATDGVRVVELDDAAVTWVGGFLERYSSLRAQVADASVMYLAERYEAAAIFTLDRRDFSVYRLTSGEAMRILPEP